MTTLDEINPLKSRWRVERKEGKWHRVYIHMGPGFAPWFRVGTGEAWTGEPCLAIAEHIVRLHNESIGDYHDNP